MQKARIVIFMVILSGIGIFSSLALAQQKSEAKSPGLETYMPTKLEWLALELTAGNTFDDIIGSRFGISYIAWGDDTIMIYVQYLPDVDRPAMNSAVGYAHKILHETKRRHKWHWVQVKEKYSKLNL